MLYTSKERIFHVEFKFIKKKYGLLPKKMKKIQFSSFLSKIEAVELVSTSNFLKKLYKTISKTDFMGSKERFQR